MNSKIKYIFLVLVLSVVVASCGIYSFQQGSIPPEIHTISIANLTNEAGGPANLSQLFTEKLKSYFQQNSRLALVQSDGDWQIEGRIVSYTVEGIAPQPNDQSELNRLNIRVSIKFVDTHDEKANYDQSFSFFSDYPKNATLSSIERDLIDKISDQIVFDIFTRTTSNW